MKRVVCYFFPTDTTALFDAYATAATHPPFERECRFEPYHTIHFGLNFSMKYNMNGGACILRFIPVPDGAAVNIHFIIAQAVGARYEAYAEDLTNRVAALLGMPATKATIDPAIFEKEEYKVTPQPTPPPAPTEPLTPATPPVAEAPVPVAPPAPPRSRGDGQPLLPALRCRHPRG